MSIKETIGTRIGKLRTENEMSQQALGELLGVRREQINYYEADSRLPKLREIKQLAEVFGVTTDYLLCVSDSRKAENIDIAKQLGLTDKAIETLEKINKQAQESQISKIDVINMLLDQDAGLFILYAIHTYLESDPTVNNEIIILRNGIVLDLDAAIANSDYRMNNSLTNIDVNRTVELGAIESIKETLSRIKRIIWENAIKQQLNKTDRDILDLLKDYKSNLEDRSRRVSETYPQMVSNKGERE